MKKPLISVIIPTHNAEQTIDQCLDSVVNQTFSNIQIICCDDCSSDNTVQKLKEWQERDGRIIILQNSQNIKVARTRNRCIDMSEGEFIAQVDDDDYCDIHWLEIQQEFLSQHKEYDYVGSGFYRFSDEMGIWGESGYETGKSIQASDFLRTLPVPNCAIMFRAKALKSVGGYRVSRETVRSEDYDLQARLYINGFRGFRLPNKLLYYRCNRETFKKYNFLCFFHMFIIRCRYFYRLGLLPKGFFYLFKPFLAFLIPSGLKEYYTKRRV